MFNDPIADTLIRIKNGYLAKKPEVAVEYSKMNEELVKLIVKNGFAEEIKVAGSGQEKKIIIKLKYIDKQPAIFNVVRVSKPSLRIYVNKDNIPSVFGGLGKTIISTPKGLLTGSEARKKHLGGEVICKIW